MTAPELDIAIREEIFRSARLCAPCLDRLPPLTFGDRPAGHIDSWCDAVLLRHLAPALAKARHAIASGGARELVAIDDLLDRDLAGPAGKNSRDAAHLLQGDGAIPAGEKSLGKYLTLRTNSGARGHFVTLFGARSAIFHIPPQIALGSLIFLELRSLPAADVWRGVAQCWHKTPQALTSLRAA